MKTAALPFFFATLLAGCATQVTPDSSTRSSQGVNRYSHDQMKLIHDHMSHIETRLAAIESTLGIEGSKWFPKQASELMEWIKKEDESNPDKISIEMARAQLYELMIILDQCGRMEDYYLFANSLKTLNQKNEK